MNRCHCKNEILGNDHIELRLELEQELYKAQMDEHVPTIQSCCLDCIQSMLHDLRTERQAIEDRTNKSWKITKLDEQSEEYKMVSQKFHESMTNTICQIEKNINPNINKNVVGTYLFHGSGNVNYINILRNGFDVSKSRDGMLGRGIYFAQNASVSHDYTYGLTVRKDKQTVWNMLLCKVDLTGARSGTLSSSAIWCVPDDTQCYPEYIIYYR